MPSGFGHANHPGVFINPKSQSTEANGLVRSRAGTAKTQKITSPTRSNTLGKKDFIAVENQRIIPCRATAAAQNLRPRTKRRADGINAAARILFIVLFSAGSNCQSGDDAAVSARRRASPLLRRPIPLRLCRVMIAWSELTVGRVRRTSWASHNPSRRRTGHSSISSVACW